MGADAIIGVSTHNIEQLRQAVLEGATYLGVGPTFASATKQFDEFPGLEFVRASVKETSLPVVVLGGINLNTLEQAVAAGARRVAVSDAICRADDPQQVSWISLSERDSFLGRMLAHFSLIVTPFPQD